MSEWINTVISSYSCIFYIRQLLVILGITAFGELALLAFPIPEEHVKMRPVLAFPMGLALYILLGYLLLLTGIPFSRTSVLCGMGALAIVFVCLLLYRVHRHTLRFAKRPVLFAVISALCIVAATAFSVSGIVPITLSNDSMYYFREYPKALTYFGEYRFGFTTFLTDTGQGASVLFALPSLFGFDEAFGIQQFFHISFLGIFGMAVYNQVKSVPASIFAVLFLEGATPFMLLAHWSMSNIFFMEYFFTAVYLMYAFGKDYATDVIIFVLALTLLRMEGAIFGIFLVIAMSLLQYSSLLLSFAVLVPMMLMNGLYAVKIFGQIGYMEPYLFLTPQKSALQVAAMAGVCIYLLFFRKFFTKKLGRFLPGLILLALFVGNLCLLALDSALYIGNLKAFVGNLFGQSGWGIFAYFIVSVLLLLLGDYLLTLFRNKEKVTWGDPLSFSGFFDFISIGFVLVTLMVSWARDSVMLQEVGDSGNRVLLQIVPVVWYMIILHVQRRMKSDIIKR